jgi:formate/nitrite transporter FocA (FNT family)
MDRQEQDDDQQKQQQQQQQDDEAHQRSAPSGAVVYQAIMKEAENELERSSSALFWSGLAAGLSMGFSLLAEAVLRSYLPDKPWRPLVVKLGYSVGFVIVILGRQQLFTENTLTPVLPLLRDKRGETLWNMLRLWVVVLAANLLGALAMSAVLARTPIVEPHVHDAMRHIGEEAMRHGFGVTLLKGIFAGWLIATIVWLLPFAETSRVWVIILITYVVGIAQLSHIIAGAVDSFALAWMGGASWGKVLGGFVLPALIGNIIGGVTLVAALNHAQVVAGGGREDA